MPCRDRETDRELFAYRIVGKNPDCILYRSSPMRLFGVGVAHEHPRRSLEVPLLSRNGCLLMTVVKNGEDWGKEKEETHVI